MIQISRIHGEAGPEFDEFFESLKLFVEKNSSALHYESCINVSNTIIEELCSRLVNKCKNKPRLVDFINTVRTEENYFKNKYENMKERADPEAHLSLKEEPKEEDYDFDKEPESENRPRRKIFLIDETQNEDDELEERYYSEKSSD